MNQEDDVQEATGEVVDERAVNGQAKPSVDAGQTATEGFGTTSLAGLAETSSVAMAAKAKAMVEARYIVAMQRPRDIDKARVQILKACRRPSFAKVARYRKPVGDGVYGPSIRFAEEAMRCMGNAVSEVSLVFEDSTKRVFNATVTDLEANTPWSIDITVEKTVERSSPKAGQKVYGSRVNSKGKRVYIVEATDDDMLNKQNALISKAIRTLILRIVPGDILEEAMALVIQTQQDEDAKDPDAARKGLIYSFSLMGIFPADLEAYLGHNTMTATPAELGELRALGLAIRDGEASWSDALEAKQSATAATRDQPPQPATAKGKVAAAAAKATETTPKPDETPKPAQSEPKAAAAPTSPKPPVDEEAAAAEEYFAKQEASKQGALPIDTKPKAK